MTTTFNTTLLLDAALAYAALNWPVVPLHTPGDDGVCDCPKRAACGSAGKHPRTLKGLDAATVDEAQIRRWWKSWPHANIGIDLARAGLVDVAPDSGEWHAEFIARGLPPTFTFKSGGGDGHVHYFYQRSDECPIYRLTATGEYDVLSAGYAVMPPSLHHSGRRYAWLEPGGDTPHALPGRPEPLWARGMLLERTARRQERAQPTLDDAGGPPVVLRGDALERWYGRLYDHRPDGELDRSYSLWSLAVALLAGGLQPRLVEAALADRDSGLGWTKFTERRNATERYRIIVERAVASQGPRRIHLNGVVAPAKEERRRKQAPQALVVETIAEFNASEDEDVTWLAYGILAEGLITELDGKAKRSGKTTLLLSLASAILHGLPFLGHPTTYSPVLYLTEQSGPSFKRSLRRSGLVDGDAFHIVRWNRNAAWQWEQLIPEVLIKLDALDAHVLIIDTLPQFSGVRGDDENKSGRALEVMEPLQAATGRRLAIMISRHDRKAGGEVGDSGRGSSAYAGAVDVILHLDRPLAKPGTERQRVIGGISRFEETPDDLLVQLSSEEPHVYTVVGNVEEVRTRDMRIDMIAAAPTSADEAVDRDRLDELVAGRAIDKARTLKGLVADGTMLMILKTPDGRQRPKQHFYLRTWGDDDD